MKLTTAAVYGTGRVNPQDPSDLRHARSGAEMVVYKYSLHGFPGPEVVLTSSAFVHVRPVQGGAPSWVVLCPFCPGAQYADPDDHRFFCCDCGNAPVGGKWVAVVWPDQPDAIEAMLSIRPDPSTRVWEPGETVFTLAAENLTHGVTKAF